MFQIKNFVSIAAGCINWMKSVTDKITDYNTGSIARTMIEGPAAEMDELYQQMLIGLQEAIPVSVFNTFGFSALAAEAASGVIRFSTGGPLAASPIIIPAGTVVKVPSTAQAYATLAQATLLQNTSYIDVLVAAQSAGVTGNVGANVVTQLSTAISGITSVTNPSPFTNGRDAETDDERTTRFQGYISTLARGTKSAIVYGAKTAKLTDINGLITEYVAMAAVVEPYVADNTQPISLVNVYVHNGASATSSDLVAKAQSVIDGYYDAAGTAFPGWKAAGVKAVVIAASDKAINVTGTLTALSGYDHSTVATQAAAAVQAYIQGLDIGATVILSEIVAIIKRDIPGVYNIVLTVPSGDVTCAQNEKAISGTVTIS